MLKKIKKISSSLVVAVAIASNLAVAGEFETKNYGSAAANDIADLVSDAFTKKYPSSKFEIFLYSESDQNSKGAPYCNAIAGVVIKNSNDFPWTRYSATSTGAVSIGAMNVGDKKAWAKKCARMSVENMLSDDLDKIYQPYPTAK